eukprot:g78062.t1
MWSEKREREADVVVGGAAGWDAMTTPACFADRSWPLSFGRLDKKLQRRFRSAGCRRGEMSRDVLQAEALYRKVPRLARTCNRDVQVFLSSRDASHIRPHGAQRVQHDEGFNALNAEQNLEWELAGPNRARGNAHMTSRELRVLRWTNRLEAWGMWWERVQGSAFRCGLLCFALRLPLELLDGCQREVHRLQLRRGPARPDWVGLFWAALPASCAAACTAALFSLQVSLVWSLLPEGWLYGHQDSLQRAGWLLQHLGWACYLGQELLPRAHRLYAVLGKLGNGKVCSDQGTGSGRHASTQPATTSSRTSCGCIDSVVSGLTLDECIN